MKVFRCGDVVPGCTRELEAGDEQELLRAVGEHARADHGTELDDAALSAVRAQVRST
ncbi:DUF1059 domain-containing protein [uncultured Pseudokineococcus sp.]|uniref:DUF1059 domain-containing protein n=1 Tax=uncultured Pseudokineococcus sp. TaxID=1642928 RepID=UPI00262F4792|nr:DUF1059 domain-containing protein [uncultured Pseudokineococcus sp.]